MRHDLIAKYPKMYLLMAHSPLLSGGLKSIIRYDLMWFDELLRLV